MFFGAGHSVLLPKVPPIIIGSPGLAGKLMFVAQIRLSVIAVTPLGKSRAKLIDTPVLLLEHSSRRGIMKED